MGWSVRPVEAVVMLLALLVLVSGACGPSVSRIDVEPAEIALSKVGSTLQINAEPKDRRGAKLSGAIVNFRAREPSVATVSSSGLVTAVAHGTTTIEVRVEGTDYMEFVHVVVRLPEKIEVRPSSTPVYIGGQKVLTAKVLDHDDKVFNNIHIDWSTSNEKIATVEDGTVTGLDEGEATITAKGMGIEGVSKIRVVWSPALKLAIDAEKRALRGGGGGRKRKKSGPSDGSHLGADPRLKLFE